jgi:hypothetical protein
MVIPLAERPIMQLRAIGGAGGFLASARGHLFDILLGLDSSACFRVDGVGGESIWSGSQPHHPQNVQTYMKRSFS